MKNYPYTTQWKDGKQIPNQNQNVKDKGTPNPLQRSSINMNDDVPWCIVCQSPHSTDYCVVAQYFVLYHSTHNDEEDEKSHDDVSCNMVSMFDDCIDSDLDKPDNDVTSHKIAYQTHHQKVFLDDENYDKDKVCNVSSIIEHINLRMPSKEEIDKIIVEMIS